MVKLEEVEDEAFKSEQPGPTDEGDWDTDDESDVSSIASVDDEPLSESVTDRIVALADMIPPHTRLQLRKTAESASEWGWWGFTGLAKTTWLLTVSGLLLTVPFAIGSTEDQMIAMEEKQQQMQQGSNEIMAPGATSSTPKAQQSL